MKYAAEIGGDDPGIAPQLSIEAAKIPLSVHFYSTIMSNFDAPMLTVIYYHLKYVCMLDLRW